MLIRKIEPDDIPTVVSLVREFAAFEGPEQWCEITHERLERAMFSEAANLEGLIAFDDNAAVAYALFFPSFSSFRGHRGFFVDDLYVRESHRSRGVGRALLREIALIAIERGFERIDLLVLGRNTRAIRFYEAIGARTDEQELHYKFTDDALRELADLEFLS